MTPEEQLIELIENAHMAGQADAGVDPGYSNARAYCDAVAEKITEALKAQDRDTRHACAEAVLEIYTGIPRGVDLYVSKDKAHAACMNAGGRKVSPPAETPKGTENDHS